jgi:flagellar hook-length control protein FliK
MSETAADKTAAAGAALRQRATGGAAVKGDVVEQIVQRAALHLKNDQGEARIDLKPEFLGQVRMQVVTDSQQVTVRIVTELPMVRDLIEQNLHQLKSDLQQQGLQVERVEVSVADDPRRDAGRQDRTGGRRNGRGPDALEGPELGSTEQRAQTLSDFWSSGGRTTINMFV